MIYESAAFVSTEEIGDKLFTISIQNIADTTKDIKLDFSKFADKAYLSENVYIDDDYNLILNGGVVISFKCDSEMTFIEFISVLRDDLISVTNIKIGQDKKVMCVAISENEGADKLKIYDEYMRFSPAFILGVNSVIDIYGMLSESCISFDFYGFSRPRSNSGISENIRPYCIRVENHTDKANPFFEILQANQYYGHGNHIGRNLHLGDATIQSAVSDISYKEFLADIMHAQNLLLQRIVIHSEKGFNRGEVNGRFHQKDSTGMQAWSTFTFRKGYFNNKIITFNCPKEHKYIIDGYTGIEFTLQPKDNVLVFLYCYKDNTEDILKQQGLFNTAAMLMKYGQMDGMEQMSKWANEQSGVVEIADVQKRIQEIVNTKQDQTTGMAPELFKKCIDYFYLKKNEDIPNE